MSCDRPTNRTVRREINGISFGPGKGIEATSCEGIVPQPDLPRCSALSPAAGLLANHKRVPALSARHDHATVHPGNPKVTTQTQQVERRDRPGDRNKMHLLGTHQQHRDIADCRVIHLKPRSVVSPPSLLRWFTRCCQPAF